MERFDAVLGLVAGAASWEDATRRTRRQEALSGLGELVQSSGLEEAWDGVLRGASLTLMQAGAYRLVTGYRAASNFLASHAPFDAPADVTAAYSRSEYTHLVMLALLRVVSGASNQQAAAFGDLLPGLPLDAHVALLEALIPFAQQAGSDIKQGEAELDFGAVVRAIPADWLLEGAWLLLRLARRANPSQPSKDILPLLCALVERAVASGTPALDVVDTLLLKKALDEPAAASIMRLLPAQSLPEALEAIASVWGCRLFISRGDLKMQRYLTAAILTGIEGAAEAGMGDGAALPLSVVFSTGISAYLDLSSSASRLLGMRVAMKVAALTGHDLVFDEVIEADEQAAAVPKNGTPRADASHLVKTDEKNLSQPKNDDESDSDSELEAFDLGADDDAKPSACYLRTCLDLLRHHDSNSSAHDKHMQALVSIPRIVASRPLDARDLASEVMRELVRLGNTFNLEKFDSLRGDAMLSLLQHYPELTVPVCAGAIEGDAMLGCKLLCVHALIRAAHALSGVPFDGVQAIAHCAEETSLSAISDSSKGRLGVTRVKRPRMLARLLRKPKVFRNSFGPVAILAFQPIVSTIRALASKPGVGDEDEGESVESLLPSQLLLALAAFTTCAVNTPVQRTLVQQTLQVSQPFTLSASLSIRRSALAACLAALQALSQSSSRAPALGQSSRLAATATFAHGRGLGPLAALSSLTRTETAEPSSVSGLLDAFVSLVDQCLVQAAAEADGACRGLQAAIVRSAVALAEGL